MSWPRWCPLGGLALAFWKYFSQSQTCPCCFPSPSVLLFPITHNLSSNLPTPNIHIFYTLTIFSACSISLFKQRLVFASSHTLFLCNYFEISSQCVVYHGSIWHWALCGCSRGPIVSHSLVGTYWKRATPLYYWYSGNLRLNGEWVIQVFFSLWKYEWSNMNASNN